MAFCPRLRRFAPDNALESAGIFRNKSGTAEVIHAFVSLDRDKGVFFAPTIQ